MYLGTFYLPCLSNALMTDLSCQSWLHITLKFRVVILWSVVPYVKAGA